MSTLAADLLCALRGAGYHVGLNQGRLALKPPAAGMSAALRDRVADHRDALKMLLASDDPFAGRSGSDPLLLSWEVRRCPLEHHANLVTTYLERFAATGRAVDAEISAWFVECLAEHDRLAASEATDNGPPPVEPDEDAEPFTDDADEDASPAIYVCVGCGLPRSRRDEPCPSCGATTGRWFHPYQEDAALPTLAITCAKCRREYTPAPQDFVKGTWKLCPGCRDEAPPAAAADPPTDEVEDQRGPRVWTIDSRGTARTVDIAG